MRLALVIAVSAAVVAPAAGAAPDSGFAFGRTGGNIRPYNVTIANDGTVQVSGAVQVGRMKLTRAQLGVLNRLAATNRFATLPAATNCPGTLPDVAATYVRVGGRTVRVHGACLTRYERLWKALGSAVHLKS
ncbi:MAG: hypothetical protein QOF43_1527 [Gaiellaceae bacterium]|nr:hypothetical protein [Gaiellaceae bacterium]